MLENDQLQNQLEFEESIEDSDTTEIFNTPASNREILSEFSDKEIKDLYTEYCDGELIVNPDFQRHYVWDRQKATKLIESALLRIPLPVIYLAEEQDGKCSVIDGQQRLTSFFSYKSGKFPNGKDFKLGNMQFFPEYKGKKFNELPIEIQRQINKCKFRVITLKKDSDPNLKFNVFERLNTGATALNDQEIRNCVYHGSYNDLLKELASYSDFKEIIGIEGKEKRMLDVELVLRFAAFFNLTYLNYRAPIKSFLNEEMRNNINLSQEKADKIKKAFKNSVSLVKSMLGHKAFRRFNIGTADQKNGNWEPKKFNVSLYDILMYGFANKDKNLVMRNLDAIREAYIDLMTTNVEFCECIERSTSSQHAVRKRFDLWRQRLDAILDADILQNRCFSTEFKRKLFEENPVCAICGQQIASLDDSAVDHIEQYWRGGETIPENARLTHRYCNCHRRRNE